ncbi:hypothetical protein PYH37_005112 [Sinorhizobium numidicum]|uniref:Uncharacterized protein n=1 Tax=Sinorhizobium numidicum TaxID=680248 RepID=A0ABY8CZ85_9HYPH|nr:hypothetical protein [Sinorhizobium numidicum]WEX76776.1 hypothetical protein PYH37_005112 [Sinorhizobium numidicum]WEX83437.1 hypothetical protein PYH38_005824 [Sinorhizobium numidicum]
MSDPSIRAEPKYSKGRKRAQGTPERRRENTAGQCQLVDARRTVRRYSIGNLEIGYQPNDPRYLKTADQKIHRQPIMIIGTRHFFRGSRALRGVTRQAAGYGNPTENSTEGRTSTLRRRSAIASGLQESPSGAITPQQFKHERRAARDDFLPAPSPARPRLSPANAFAGLTRDKPFLSLPGLPSRHAALNPMVLSAPHIVIKPNP